jgi:hypothetical protein
MYEYFGNLRGMFNSPIIFIAGLVVTIGLGILVDIRLNRMMGLFRQDPPKGFTPEDWTRLIESPDAFGGRFRWLGLIERLFFFYAMSTPGGWILVGGWLVLKLGCYWGMWYCIPRVNGSAGQADVTGVIVTQGRRASALATTCLFATLADFLAALAGTFAMVAGAWMIQPVR